MGTNPPDDKVLLGDRYVHGYPAPFGLETVDRRQHLYVIGKTGTGKSTLLRNMILQDILAGRGIGLVDPHGDLAESILEAIPSWRAEDVVYFDPSDTENPIGLNLLECEEEGQGHLIPSEITSIFRSIWPDFWGPRLAHILNAVCATLVECGGQTLLGVQRILTDSRFREEMVAKVEDPFLRLFWRTEFDTYSKQFATEAIAPVLNKIGRLTIFPILRNIIGQPKSGFSVPLMMNQNKIFIANLSKGLMGEEKSNLIGSLLVAKFHLSAMARASMPESHREDFYLYVDEFHNFTTESFASMLEEARKYRLCLTLAHQHMGQLTDRVRTAVLGNAGSILSFRVGSADAEVLAKEFHGDFPPRRFTELANHEVCAKLLERHEATQPFLGRTHSGVHRRFGRGRTIKRRSRERYASRREKVEERLDRWLNPKPKQESAPRSYRRKLSG